MITIYLQIFTFRRNYKMVDFPTVTYKLEMKYFLLNSMQIEYGVLKQEEDK
jgi:hypothetical protein